MDKETIDLNLDLFQCKEAYLCKIDIPESVVGLDNGISTIVILDKSGSMYGSMEKITQSLLPELFTNLKYKDNQLITIISFSTKSQIQTYEFSEIKEGIEIDASGHTEMCPALKLLEDFLEKDTNKNVRILSISDGELDDQEETVKYSNEILDYIKQHKLLVNSQAIRFFTSTFQPDTRGLSACLQFSNVSNPKLIDIQADTYKYDKYEDLFQNDSFDSRTVLECESESIKIEPWENYAKEISLKKGENIFWMKKKIGDKLLEGEDDLINIAGINKNKEINFNIELKEQISFNNFKNIISGKVNFYMQKLKVFKVLGSDNSLKQMDTIIEFFEKFENQLLVHEEVKKLDNSLKSRLTSITKQIKKRKNSVFNQMAQIRNDEKISKLNSQQQAEYLRKIDTNDRTSKALARRAYESGLNFDEVAKQEVIEISKHIKELDDVDESKLTESFYSTCNTLEGIRTVSELPQDKEIFDELTANDIIKLLNIVGVAAYAPYGNYPDPMTYRLAKIYPSTFVSISDILTAFESSSGKDLTEIGRKENIITTCVPHFEDERIHLFLLKYAPHLLEMTASIGMRKMISEVPYTYEYSILAGFWKMVQIVLKERSEINTKIFINLINNYKLIAKDHFGYVINLVEKQKKAPKTIDSIYIANNGITNMIYPLAELISSEKNDIDREFIQKIIRATYQFEVYQYIRKLIRKQDSDKRLSFIKKSLIELLNIDLQKNRTKLNPHFQSDDQLPIYEDYIPNIELSKTSYIQKLFWLDYIVAIPILLKAALDKNDPIGKLKGLPENILNPEFIKKELGIEYDLDLFKFNCIIQCFLYKDKADRVDTQEKKMLISDLFFDKHFDKVIKKYVKGLFKEEFQKDKDIKTKEELQLLKKEIVDQLTKAETMEEFTKLLTKGIKKGETNMVILNSCSNGYNDLLNTLLDTNIKDIPFRGEKLLMILIGRDKEGNVVWNQGNVFRDRDKIAKAKSFSSKELIEQYEKVDLSTTYHVYRGGSDFANRHGHSNDLPSYWAIGFNSVSEMAKGVSEEFMKDYYKKHINCCGLAKNKLNYTQRKKLQRLQAKNG